MQKKKTDLLTIPFVGKKTKECFSKMGIDCVEALIGKDPEELYLLDCLEKNFTKDRCQLYVFRMAVYFAETPEPEAHKLKWWYWKDKK